MTLPRAARLSAIALLLAATALVLTAWTGGLSPSLIEADEGAHYVNALFLGDWIRAGFPASIAFARGFYAHFPRLTIGHWPPAWYMLEAPLFALFRPSPLAATCASALLAGLAGIVIVWAFDRLRRPMVGVALGIAYTALPLVIDSARYILVDQPLALAVGLAAIAWWRVGECPSWWRVMVFAMLAALCPLIKGNGALVALIPAIDIALSRRWPLMRLPRLWVAGVVALAIVAPWYWLSFRISADGFNYAPGTGYAWMALAANAAAIVASIGGGGVILAAVGAAITIRGGDDRERAIARLSVAVVASTLLFQSLVPASLAPRYIAPLLPWLVVLGGMGAVRLVRHGRASSGIAVLLAAWAAAPAIVTLETLPPKPDIGAVGLAARMAAAGGVWLVDGRSGAEGALIAAGAYADGGRERLWVARASQWLSTSDFMGRGYRLLASDPAGVVRILDRVGTAGVVSVALHDQPAFAHSPLLRRAVMAGDAYRITDHRFGTGDGSVLVARRRAAIRPNIPLLASDGSSAKVSAMTAAWH